MPRTKNNEAEEIGGAIGIIRALKNRPEYNGNKVFLKILEEKEPLLVDELVHIFLPPDEAPKKE